MNLKKILIIEDDQDIRENLAEILELANYKTYEAHNGKIGIELAKRYSPDLILCDIMMPELDGFGVLKIINKDPELFKIPFLFLTAKTEHASFRKGMGLGADDYITKPFDDVELLDSIEMRLRKSELLLKIDNSDIGLRTFFNEARAEKELEELSQDREERKYNKKDLIYEEDQIPKYLFYVNSGQVKTYQRSDSGKELITNLYSKGDFYGYINLLNNEKYTENALALENSLITLIPAEDFRLLLFKSRDFSAKFISMLANHAGHSESQLIEIAYSSVRKKLANALLSIAEKSNKMGYRISREDLASFTGSAKETITRTLTDFKHEGLIEVKGSEIIILLKDALKNMPQ